MTAGSERASVGSIAEEAARLLDAVQGWSRRTFPEEHLATGSPECTWCPVCRLVSLLRGDRLDTGERAADIATTAVAALRALLDGATSSHEHAPRRRVERIDLGADVGPSRDVDATTDPPRAQSEV